MCWEISDIWSCVRGRSMRVSDDDIRKYCLKTCIRELRINVIAQDVESARAKGTKIMFRSTGRVDLISFCVAPWRKTSQPPSSHSFTGQEMFISLNNCNPESDYPW